MLSLGAAWIARWLGAGLLEDGPVDRELGVAVEAVTMAGH